MSHRLMREADREVLRVFSEWQTARRDKDSETAERLLSELVRLADAGELIAGFAVEVFYREDDIDAGERPPARHRGVFRTEAEAWLAQLWAYEVRKAELTARGIDFVEHAWGSGARKLTWQNSDHVWMKDYFYVTERRFC